MKFTNSHRWNLVRYFLIIATVSLTIYFGLFGYFSPPFEFSSVLRGPSDRNLHIAALASMTLAVMIGQRRQIPYLFLMLGFATVLELIQVWLPSRAASTNDLMASLAGVIIGACLASTANYVFRKIRLARAKPG